MLSSRLGDNTDTPMVVPMIGPVSLLGEADALAEACADKLGDADELEVFCAIAGAVGLIMPVTKRSTTTTTAAAIPAKMNLRSLMKLPIEPKSDPKENPRRRLYLI